MLWRREGTKAPKRVKGFVRLTWSLCIRVANENSATYSSATPTSAVAGPSTATGGGVIPSDAPPAYEM